MTKDHNGDQPSRRIAADLRASIVREEYLPGHQLPSGTALMAQYGVARQTVQNAIELLRGEGLVTSRAGAGVFVRERPTVRRLARNRLSRAARHAGRGAFIADTAADGCRPHVDVMVSIASADERVADALEIQPGDPIVVRDRVMRADDHVVQLAKSCLPRLITEGSAIEQENTGPTGMYGVLESLGHELGHFVEYVATRLMTVDEAALFEVGKGAPVLTLTRIAYDIDGAPLEINDMTLLGDGYELVYQIPAE